MTSLISGVVATALTAAALLFACPQAANAVPGTCTTATTAVLTGPNFNANFSIISATQVRLNGVDYSCIQQQDKLFSSFSFADIAGSGTAVLKFANIGGEDTHTIQLGSSGFTNGGTYNVGYNIAIIPGARPILI